LGVFGKTGPKQITKFLDFKIGASLIIPRVYANQAVILKGSWTAFNWITHNKYYPDLAVGGVVDLKFYEYPERYNEQKYWKIRFVSSVQDRLKHLSFPPPEVQQGEPIYF
jgi:hypothetical protein